MLMLIAFSVGNVWADPAVVGTTLFSENFGGYSADDVPSGSVSSSTGNRVIYGGGSVTYTSADNGTNLTKIYAANLAGGTSPELLVGKSGGVFTITGIPSGDAQEITVSFKQNAQKLTISLDGTGYSTTYASPKPSAAGTVSFDITVADGADATFSLIMTAGSSNVRVDDILVTVKTAGEGGAPAKTLTSIAVSGAPTKTSYYAGDEFDPAGLTVTGTYSDESTSPITSGITWSYNPSQTLSKGQTTIGVTATVSEISSLEFEVTGLSVTDLVVSNWQVTAPADLTTGDVVVITMLKNSVYYAAPNNGSGAPAATVVAVANSKLSNSPAETLQWTVTVVEDGVYQFSKGTNYLKCTDTNNGVRVGTGDYNTFDVVVENEKSYLHTTETMTSATNGRYLGIYNTQDWRCYSSVNNNIKDGSLVIFKDASAPAAVAKPTISGDENFVTSTTVTLSHADADAIYYTTDGSDPKTSGTKQTYSVPFTVNADGTTTVKAYAVKGSDESDVAEKDFTKVTALSTMAEVQAEAAAEEKAINVAISNWVVTAVSGSQVWITDADNEKGILLYKSGHGFTAGKKLNGTVVGTKIKLYNLYPELTSLVASEVTVTDADAVSPRTTTIAALTSGHPAEQGTVVKLEGVNYTSSALFDGVNSIAADNKFFSSLALVDGTTYDITGVVTYYKNGDDAVVKIAPRSAADVEAQTPVVVPTAANLAALKAAERGTYILTLTNAVVTYVNGKNAFIEDATGGALIFFQDHGFTAGDCLNGDYQVVTTDYQGKFEITAVEPQAGAATTTAEIPLTTVSITTLNANFASYESRRIKIVGANVTDAISGSDRNGAINDGAALAVYAAVASTITLTADDNVDIIGYPGFHNTDQQLNVWRQEDITVNVKEDPELAYNPAVVNVLLSDLASFTPADLEYATGFDGLAAITYESSDPSIATVETDGTVTLVATEEGSTTITATFAGNATYKADNASYTINVSATPIAPVYTMSFDLTRASYDDAADAQVVWNSNVVTMTANQNDGTKVTNYLAGNYTGATLITQTRFYTKNSLSFVPQEGVTITKVEWMSTAKDYATKLAAETWTNASAAVDATDDKLVIITPTASGEFSVTLTNAARATGITVYYTAESEKAKLTASISIDDMNMAVGDDDILLSAIAATSNPNKKAISYAVTSGTAVTIVGTGAEAALHAAAEGSATISATIPNDLGNYTGATTTFNIVVAAAPATLESIAISGTATALEYTAGQHFNPAGLVVTGTYSDASTAPISEGIDWAFDPDPLTEGTTSVSVTATVGEISSAAVVVNGLTVNAAPAPTSGNIVILAEYNSKFYAMTNSLTSGALAGVEVEKDGSKIVVSSAEDKAAIQWTAIVDGDNTTLKDAENNYIKGSSGASLSLEADPYNWNWDGEKSCYISSAYTNRGLFFSNSGNVFKGYALSNITSDGYAATEVIEIDPEDIVISSKVDPALAYTPASDEITVGDAWSAPVLGYVEGFDGLAAITYESSNEAVATVSDAGVIALAGGTGTATITATFGGNASYLAGSATYTVKVNEPAEDCDGTDDFLDTEDKGSPTSYSNRSTPNGWTAVNAGYKVIDEKAYWMINGKTTAVGVITSPELTGGLGTLKFRYANTNSESNGVSVKIEIKQGGDVVKEYTLTKPNSEVVQNTVYTELIENINVEGTFQIVITNLSPSNNTGNKDRVSIGRFCWSNYSAPEPQYTDIRTGLTAGNYFTVCWPKEMTAIKGATLWSFAGKDDDMAYLIQEEAPFEAGKPFIAYATSEKLEAVVEGDDAAAGSYKGLHGTLVNMTNSELLAAGATYMLKDNALRPVGGGHLDANRAYVILSEITGGKPANVPAHKVRSMPMQKDAATGFENIESGDAPMKVMIEGTMYILRGEKVYDATGRLVK